MRLITIQVALFSTNLISRPDLLLTEINKNLGNIFDAMPTVLNLPLDVPIEIPLVQAKSISDEFALNISRNRIDFIINHSFENDISASDALKNYRPLIKKYCKTVIESNELNRIGIILTLFKEIKENVKAINERYFKDDFVSGTTESSLRINIQQLSKGTVINNVKDVRADVLTVKNIPHSGVVVVFDTNNVPETGKNIDIERINDILKRATAKITSDKVKELI